MFFPSAWIVSEPFSQFPQNAVWPATYTDFMECGITSVHNCLVYPPIRNMTESNPVIKQKVDERRSQITPQEAQLLDKVKEARRVNRQQAEANRTEDLLQHGRRVNLRFNVNLAGQRNYSALFGIFICAGVTAFVLVREQRTASNAYCWLDDLPSLIMQSQLPGMLCVCMLCVCM